MGTHEESTYDGRIQQKIDGCMEESTDFIYVEERGLQTECYFITNDGDQMLNGNTIHYHAFPLVEI